MFGQLRVPSCRSIVVRIIVYKTFLSNPRLGLYTELSLGPLSNSFFSLKRRYCRGLQNHCRSFDSSPIVHSSLAPASELLYSVKRKLRRAQFSLRNILYPIIPKVFSHCRKSIVGTPCCYQRLREPSRELLSGKSQDFQPATTPFNATH